MLGKEVENLKYKYLITINTISIILFKTDKNLSKSNYFKKRIPEKIFHFLGLLGGSPGNLFSMHFLKHKNKTYSFRILTYLIIISQITLLIKYRYLFY